MKKWIKKNFGEISVMIVLGIICVLALTLSGCREADRVSYNISLEADNYNTIRQITVIN